MQRPDKSSPWPFHSKRGPRALLQSFHSSTASSPRGISHDFNINLATVSKSCCLFIFLICPSLQQCNVQTLGTQCLDCLALPFQMHYMLCTNQPYRIHNTLYLYRQKWHWLFWILYNITNIWFKRTKYNIHYSGKPRQHLKQQTWL